MAALAIDAALDALLGGLRALDAEALPLTACHRRIAARPLCSPADFPFEDNSAMDGYALDQSSCPGPWRLLGEAAAGRPFPGRLQRGEAVRIFTGAVVPEGADSILIQENGRRHGDAVFAEQPVQLGRHIRAAGSDLTAGDVIVAAGRRLGPGDIAAIASLGISEVWVHKRPVVTIFATGDELIGAAGERRRGEVFESNTAMLAAACAGIGAEVARTDRLGDDHAAIKAAISAAALDSDLVLLSGGVSVGDHDHVGAVLAELCGGLAFAKVQMKPGKPVASGRIGATTLLGLPGNPASSAVAFELFARPLLAVLGGDPRPHRQLHLLPVANALPAAGWRSEFWRANFTDGIVRAKARQGSGDLTSLLAVDLLIMRPAEAPASEAGALHPCLRLSGDDPGCADGPEAQWAKLR
jgi:molybdopterin molybdotransferase